MKHPNGVFFYYDALFIFTDVIVSRGGTAAERQGLEGRAPAIPARICCSLLRYC